MSTEKSQPVSQTERVRLLDALRGFAIFGILVANMMFFTGYLLLSPERSAQLGLAGADRITLPLIDLLVDGKFYSLFSFLFGLGFAIQMMRAERGGVDFTPLFKRRLWILLVIGLAHAYLLWNGDILSIYAVTGFLLFLFRRRPDKSLLRWAIGLLAAPIVIYSLMVVLHLPDPYAFLTGESGESGFDRVLSVTASGGYWQIFKLNLEEMAVRDVELLYTSRIPKVLGMFLLGFYAGRREILLRLENHLPLVRRIFRWGLALGLIGNTALAILIEMEVDIPPSPLGIAQTAAYAVGVPSLCLFYVSALALLWRKPRWRRLLSALAPAGQMALSNYLLQTLVCVTIFYGYGFGYFGRVGVTTGVALAAAIFALQIALSNWWLRRFQYGPVEWLWRQGVYRRRLPLRLPHQSATEIGELNKTTRGEGIPL